MALNTKDYPAVLAALAELGETDKDKAAAVGVRSAKTIERLRVRLPSSLKLFVNEPRLLRALLADIEKRAA